MLVQTLRTSQPKIGICDFKYAVLNSHLLTKADYLTFQAHDKHMYFNHLRLFSL